MIHFIEKSQGLLFLGVFLVSISTIMVSLSSCSKVSAYQKSIYTDDNKIINRGDSYTNTTRIGNASNNFIDFKFSGFSGKESIWTITASEDTYIDMEVETKTDSGDFKVCLVTPQKSVSIVCEKSLSENIRLDLPIGDSILCLVGKNSKGSLKITRTDANSEISIKS